MLIKKLNLIRYGHFENRELEFADSGLTVIYGPNEAGKSTSLSAITELLYGFDHKCSYDFQFDNKHLRLGGTIVNRLGDELTFRRRKGNKATVMDADESPLPDSVLSPYLGQSDKAFFEKSFGLSQARLREGGEAIEKAEGDLGKILFEAGSGITNLAEIQMRLEVEADDIFGTRRSANKLVYQSLDKYEAAQSALKEATLKQQDWQNAQQELAEASEKLEQARGALRELTIRQAKLNRWLRVLPVYRELNSHRSALAALGPLVPLPMDARQKHESAVSSRYHAETSINEIQKRLDDLLEQIDSCAVDQDMLNAGDEIQHLYENVASIEQQLQGLPILEATIAELKRQMQSQAGRMNLPLMNELPLLPKQPDITNLTEMIGVRQQLDTKLKKVTEDQAATAAKVAQLTQDIAKLNDTTDPGSDNAVLQKLRTALAVLPDSAKLQREMDKQDKKVTSALKDLSWWAGDATTLLSIKLPIKSQIEQHRKAIDQAEKQFEVQTDKLEEAVDQLDAARRKLNLYRKRQEFYSDEDLMQARTKRLDAWLLIRRVLDEKVEPAAEEISRFEAGDELVPVYEKLTDQADEIADSRMTSAEKIVKHQTLQDDVLAREQQVEGLQSKLDKAKAELHATSAGWCELWSEIDIQPESPEVMQEGLLVIKSIKEAVAAGESVAAELADVEHSRDSYWKQLVDLGLRLNIPKPTEAHPDVLIVRIESAIAKRAETFQKAESLLARQTEQQEMHEKHQRDLAQLNDGLVNWQENWNGCCTQVGLSPQLTAAQVTEAVTAWNELTQKQTDLERREGESQQVEIRVRQFVEASSALISKLQPDTTVHIPSEAISGSRRLYTDLVQMQQLATRRRELEKQKLEVTAALERHEKAVLTAKADVSALVELAGLGNEDELASATETAEKQRRIQGDVDASQKRLHEASEGEDEEAIAAACVEISLDDVRAELIDVAGDMESAKNDLEVAKERETQTRRTVDELESKSGAAEHAQAMQNAVAKLGVQVRDYLRLQAASTMLRHGIERVRDKHKNPILVKGSEFFATLTTGSFAGITTDYDSRDNPTIVGVRPTGERVDVAGMSEGTRDQLYLALRLAFVENYCATEEPLPFIGDDLFVTSDDERTAAGLQLLSQLKHCQVILFTHHEHVKNLAKKELKQYVPAHFVDLADPDAQRINTIVAR